MAAGAMSCGMPSQYVISQSESGHGLAMTVRRMFRNMYREALERALSGWLEAQGVQVAGLSRGGLRS